MILLEVYENASRAAIILLMDKIGTASFRLYREAQISSTRQPDKVMRKFEVR